MKTQTLEEWIQTLSQDQRDFLLRSLLEFLRGNWKTARWGTTRMTREEDAEWFARTRFEALDRKTLDAKLETHPRSWRDRGAWVRALPKILPRSVVDSYLRRKCPSLRGPSSSEIQGAFEFDEMMKGMQR